MGRGIYKEAMTVLNTTYSKFTGKSIEPVNFELIPHFLSNFEKLVFIEVLIYSV
jgi:hypothetical protein